MSNVTTTYSTTPSQNVKIGSLSLKENETRIKDLNDILRKLMADIRQESNEVRGLIAAANGGVATARADAATARARANEAASLNASLNSQIATIESNADLAAQQAASALSSASSASSLASAASGAAQAAQNGVEANQSAILTLQTQVADLTDAVATGGSDVQTDGETVVSASGVLKVQDVAVGGDLEDLASGRGQIGRTAVSAGADFDALLADGWYAVGGEDVANAPSGVTAGVCRVSSGYATGTVVQTLFTAGEEPRMFFRAFDGTDWADWREPLYPDAVGDGLVLANGILSVNFPQELPDVEDVDPAFVLTAGGTWEPRASGDELAAVLAGLDEMESAIAAMQETVDGMSSSSQIEVDGTTIAIVDGAASVPLYLGATAQEDGIAGLVPPADAGTDVLFLRSDGTWGSPALEQADYVGATEEADGVPGLVPAAESAERELFLRGDGTYADPCAELEERVEAIVANMPAGGGTSGEGSLDTSAMTAADVDWIVLGVPASEEGGE